MIKKEYTKEGIKLTHPSGVVSITTLSSLGIFREQIQAGIQRLTQRIQSLDADISAVKALAADIGPIT